MKMRSMAWLVALVACGSRQQEVNASHNDAAVTATPACTTAREARTKATELERDGHLALARAKIDEANSACPSERASSDALEKKVLAALAGDATPAKGTDATMRAQMREAYAAERAKDFPRAKTLYEAAWAELHPNPRALEDAARMAALGGDAAESRRLRDRALSEAEGTEHAIAQLTARFRATRGSARLAGDTLMLAREGNVVARDTKTGELRVMVAATGAMALSPHGTLALGTPSVNTVDPLTVYDVITGARLFRVDKITRYAVSPDDSLVAVIDQTATGDDSRARIFDVATGTVKTKVTGKWRSGYELVGFGPDASHVVFFGDDPPELRPYDLEKSAYTGVRLPSFAWSAATSSNGHYLAYIENIGDGEPLHVRDLVAGKDVAQWTGNFHSVEALAVSDDGKTVATGSRSSLRLWDVAAKKQLFKHEPGSRLAGTTDTEQPREYSFSDDGKTMVLAGFGLATAWDVATGTEKPLVVDDSEKSVLRVVPAPDGGAAIVAEEEVHVVPASGEPRVVCKGMWQPYAPIIGPTNVAFSASGKSFACVMSDGWTHVFDTSTWAERAVIKRGEKSPVNRPVDLIFSSDEKTLTIVSNNAIVAYDAATGAETKRTTLRHPQSAPLMARHARFDDGSVLVRLWNGSAAIFDESGAWKRDAKLVSAPVDALDAFATSGATYAVALGKTVHVVDLATGEDHTTDLASAPKSLAISPDGKTVLVALGDGTIARIGGGAATPLAHMKGIRAAFAGKSMLVWTSKDVLDAWTPGASAPLELVLAASGVVVQNDTGAFEARGKPEVACVVGKTFLSRETCNDRSKDGLVSDWLRATR